MPGDGSSGAAPRLAPAGWYADPEHPGQLRWWGGTSWTESRMPQPTAAVALAEVHRAHDPDPLHPQNATEAKVAAVMSRGVATSQRWYPLWATGTAVLFVVAGAAVLLLLHGLLQGDGAQPYVGRLGPVLGDTMVLAGSIMLVAGLTSLVVQARRTWQIVQALPVDGSTGPGEVAARIFMAAMGPRTLSSLVIWSTVLLAAVGTGWTVLTAAEGQDGLVVVCAFVAVIAVLSLTATARQRQYRSLRGRPVPSRPLARGGTPERGTVWAAPVMRVRAPRGNGVPVGWHGLDVGSQSTYAQNALVLGSSELSAVSVEVEDLAGLPIASQTYSEAVMGLFISGIAVRRELLHRLSIGRPEEVFDAGTSLRIPLSDLVRVELSGSGLSFVLADGQSFPFVLNHPDAAESFAQQLLARGLPVVRTDLAAQGMAFAGAVPYALQGGSMWSAAGTTVSTHRTLSLLPYTPVWMMPRPYAITSRGPQRPIAVYRSDGMSPRSRSNLRRFS